MRAGSCFGVMLLLILQIAQSVLEPQSCTDGWKMLFLFSSPWGRRRSMVGPFSILK